MRKWILSLLLSLVLAAPVSAQSDAYISSTAGALNAEVVLVTPRAGSVKFTVSGTWVGTITLAGSGDLGSSFQALSCYNESTLAPLASSQTSANGTFICNGSGQQRVRGRMTAYTSGTATIAISSGATAGFVFSWANLRSADGSQLFPTAQTLANNMSVPSTSLVGAIMLCHDGSNIDFCVTGDVDQGSTTSGQKGGLIFGAVTTSAPSYTTAQSSPLSLQTDGSLRSAITNTVTVATHAVTQSGGPWTVDSELPAAGALADGASNPTLPSVGAFGHLFNGTTFDRSRSVVNATNSTGTGIAAVGLVAQLDDTSPTSITENQFGNLRMNSSRALLVDNSAVTQPISAASLPLPSGAATAANQSTGNSSLSSIDGKTPSLVSGRVPVDGSGVTQPVSGTVTATVAAVGANGSAAPSSSMLGGAKDNSGNTVQDIACTQSVIYDASTNGATQLVAISGATTIYVCGYKIFAAGTVSVGLTAGTGTACASAASGTPSTGTSGAQAKLTPSWQLTAQTGVNDVIPAHGFSLHAGSSNALCILTNAAVAVQAQVWYAQR